MFKLMTLCSAFATVVGMWTASPPAFFQESLPAPVVNPPRASAPQEDMELLMRGPLHEAFAEAPQADPVPNPAVPRQPPAPVNELPPEYKPAGENVQWIPGYWAWDDERRDFIWISGIWRDFPPGQRWVPGFWEAVAEGFLWINGFWMDAAQDQLQYYPPPPESLDVGPSTPAPSDDHFYAPGHWAYQADQFVWQPGCWLPIRPDWVWVPPTYVWTPYGCVFRPGYWDRLFDCRGLVFAPVCYNRPVYFDFNYVYTPSCVINTSYDLLPHLFVRRHCRSYYFGDWYDDRYWGNDFCAWSQIGYRRGFCGGYDPFYSYYSHVGIQFNQVNLMFWIRSQNNDCRQHVARRPPHTFAGQHDWEQRRRNDPRRGKLAVADSAIHSPLAEQLDQRVKRIQNSAVAARKLERIDVDARRNLQRQQQAAVRAQVETRRRADRESTAAKLVAEQAIRRQATAQKIESARQSPQARDVERQVERQRPSANRAAELQARKEKAATQQSDIQDRLRQSRAARDSKLQQQAAERAAQQQQAEMQNQARNLENAQRRALSEEKFRAAEQQRNIEREARRQSAGQQLQQQKVDAQRRQIELQQRRGNELAAAHAASQQKAAEREVRRQQESAQRVAQAQRASQERAARDAQNQQRQAQEQQRSAQRQAQLDSMRQRQQADQQQRQIERQQRDSQRQQGNQDRGGKRGGK